MWWAILILAANEYSACYVKSLHPEEYAAAGRVSSETRQNNHADGDNLMLIMFSGKGCGDCPFLFESSGEYACTLSYRETTEGRLPVLDAHREKKPEECPFAQFPGTLEIQAEDHD
jgi:hypothetical protein